VFIRFGFRGKAKKSGLHAKHVDDVDDTNKSIELGNLAILGLAKHIDGVQGNEQEGEHPRHDAAKAVEGGIGGEFD